MKLSKKAEYALRAIVAMARDQAGRTFSIQEIAHSERIPLKFLEQILLVLKHAGILRSKRGVGGGYQLVRPPTQIPIAEIIEQIEGPGEPIPCAAVVGTQKQCECGIIGGCALGHTMAALRDQERALLSSKTISDVIEKERERAGSVFEI